jgi:hypothetical protein
MAVLGTWWLFRRGGLLAVLLPGLAVFSMCTTTVMAPPADLSAAFLLIVGAHCAHRVERRRRLSRRAQVRRMSPAHHPGRDRRSVVGRGGVAGPRGARLADRVTDGVTDRSRPSASSSDAPAGLRSPKNLYGETFASTPPRGRPAARRSRRIPRAPSTRSAGRSPVLARRAYDTHHDGGWDVAWDHGGLPPREGGRRRRRTPSAR